MYAVVKVGGKQYRVEKGDSIVVDRLPEDEGANVALEPLLYADGKKSVFEGSDLEKVKVEAVVQGHERGRKIHVLKFKPKVGYKRRTGHRSELTRLAIGDIKVLTRKPATKKAAEQKPASKQKPAAKRSTGRKQPTKKPAAKKPAARKKQEKKDGS
jgi:large subunit ribosomal protein L21